MIAEIELNHNHRMIDSPTMLLHMHSHKTDDPLLDKLVKDMQSDNLKHTQMMSTLSRMSGGLHFMVAESFLHWSRQYQLSLVRKPD